MARLHYLVHDIQVPLGTFFIGRGADCQLALDDSMVSRRHAALRIYAGSALVEDLGSRNGVFLNGVRIDRPEPLHDGDHIRIGSQDLSFYENDDAHPLSGDRATKATRREMQLTELRELEPDDPSEQTYVATGPMSSVPRAGSGLAIIGGVADKALALGRADEAERILQRALADILSRATAKAAGEPRPAPAKGDSQPPASAGGEVDLDLAERAAGYAVRLAAGTGHGTWVDYTFQLYTALGALLPARIVDELYAAVRKVKYTDKAVLRAYTTRLREVSSGFGPAERFVLQRIEGFERWAPSHDGGPLRGPNPRVATGEPKSYPSCPTASGTSPTTSSCPSASSSWAGAPSASSPWTIRWCRGATPSSASGATGSPFRTSGAGTACS